MPVAAAELDLWVRAGRSPAEIAGDIRARGLLQAPDDAVLGRLRAAEADPTLLRWLATPEVSALVVSPEAAAQARESAARLREQKESDRQAFLSRLESTPVAPRPTAPAPATAPAAGLAFTNDFDAARARAGAERKLLLLVFASADEDASSLTSQRLREICRHPDFLAAATPRLLGVRVACPRPTDTVAAGSLAARNRELMPFFNVDRLPTVWLADANGSRLFKLVRWEENPRAFLEEFQVALEKSRSKSGPKTAPPVRPVNRTVATAGMQ